MEYKDFESLNKAFPDRNALTDTQHREYVNTCFEIYENIGFCDVFESPYEDGESINGMKFTVIERVPESSDEESGVDLECLPMWLIRLENGEKMRAYPEEICRAERESA